jgi:hypothetical protein
MKSRGITLAVVILSLAATAYAGEPKYGTPTGPPNPGFERLKALLGTWEGTGEDGKAVEISYSLVSVGSALEEKLGPADEPSMVTMYHPDGMSVLMTHYCGAQNQPRMRAKDAASDAKVIDFSFVDCSNLSAKDAGHMHHLRVSFEDPDHFSQEWTWKEKAKEGKTVFHFARKKS